MTKKILFAASPLFVVGYLFTAVYNDGWKLEIYLDLIPGSPSARRLVALPYLGIALGAILVGWLADHYGRKRFIIVNMVGLIIACLCIFTVTDTPTYIIIACLIGLFMGGTSTASVLYVIDSSTKKTSLKNAMYLMLIFIAGQAVSEIINDVLDSVLLNSMNINHSWQWIGAGAGLLGIISILLTRTLPKSEAFLNLETKQAMAVNRHNLHNSQKKHAKESRYHLQFNKKTLLPMIIGIGIVIIYSFIPFIDIKYYCFEALSDAGLNLGAQDYIFAVLTLLETISVMLAIRFIKPQHYAKILVIFTIILAVIMVLIAADLMFNLYSGSGIIISVVLIVLYSVIYSVSWFAIAWAIIFTLFAGEKFARIRGLMIGLMLFVDWVFFYLFEGNFFLAWLHLTTPGWLVFYTVVAVVGAIVVRHFLTHCNIKLFRRRKVGNEHYII